MQLISSSLLILYVVHRHITNAGKQTPLYFKTKHQDSVEALPCCVTKRLNKRL